MLEVAIWTAFMLTKYGASAHCIDIHSQVVSDGLHYVPGPNTCTLCICDKGSPKWCKSVLCSTPQNCKSFEQGNSCCEFKCLDDILANDGYKNIYDLVLRLIASGFTALLSLSILFLLYQRLRRRKIRLRQSRQNNEDQRSLNSIGYIAGGLGYHPGNYGYIGNRSSDLEFPYEESNTHFSLWKPPGNYFPRGDAPPPYEEAVRSAQLENDNNTINNETVSTCSISNQITNTYTFTTPQPAPLNQQQYQNGCCVLLTRNDTSTGCHKEYVNIPLSAYNSVMTVSGNEKAVNSLCTEYSCSSSSKQLKQNSKELHNKVKTPEEIVVSIESNVPASGSNNSHTSDKVEVPRNSRIDKVNNPVNGVVTRKCYMSKCHSQKGFPKQLEIIPEKLPACYYSERKNQEPQNLPNESHQSKSSESSMEERIKILRQVHEKATRLQNSQVKYSDEPHHRTISKSILVKNKIPVSSNTPTLARESKKDHHAKNTSYHHTLPSNLRDISLSLDLQSESKAASKMISNKDNDIHLKNLTRQNWNSVHIPSNSKTPILDKICQLKESLPSPSIIIQESVENNPSKHVPNKGSQISYHCLTSLQDDDEDYRSECENCKFNEIPNEENDGVPETMTLHRKPLELEEQSYYRTSLTLPTNTKKVKIINSKPGRENWFLAMHEYSSSDDST